MPGVTRGETVDTDNPLLWFAFQANGVLTDVYELKMEVQQLDGTVKVAEVTIDLNDPPTGMKLGTGRYSANFTTDATWKLGTHVVIWRYKISDAADPQLIHEQHFELLDPKEFRTGRIYVGYADSSSFIDRSPFKGVQHTQKLINNTSRYVELLTARFFEPRYLQASYSGLDGPILFLGHPVIGLVAVYELGIGPADQLFSVDLDSLRIFNRHLEGLLDPDDRDHPRLEFATDLLPGRTLAQGTFAPGSKNIEVRGVFGYTDPDGGPLGQTPHILERVIGILGAKEAADPFAQDPFISASGRIKSAKTRDQAVSFDTGSGRGSVQAGAVTGDRAVDDFLLNLLRPPGMAVI